VVSAEVIEPSGIRARPLAGPARQTIRVGCSGWQYAHWRGDFYPAELPASRWFAPPHFLYAVKASRFLTHMKKLKDRRARIAIPYAFAPGFRSAPASNPNFQLPTPKTENLARRAGLGPESVWELGVGSWNLGGW